MRVEPSAGDAKRVVLVTGGSRGIGAAIATQLARRNCRVACTYRTGVDEVQELARQAPPGLIAAVPYDLGDPASAGSAVDATVAEFGAIDSIILNAGVWSGGLLADMDPDAWWGVIERNLRGTAAITRAALPYLRKSDSPSVVVVSSVVGIIGTAGDTAYGSAKAATIGFARSLAKEVAREGIRVNVLAPGFVETDMTSQVSDGARARIEQATILGRFGTADEIASAAVFLSEDATFCTGSILVADGGWSI
ncbi:MAG: SDR family oxidoreductase [Mycobacterium sp.]